MKVRFFLPVLFGFVIIFSAPAQERIAVSDDVVISRIADGIWMHVSWTVVPEYGRVEANGIFAISGGEAILVDTPWTSNQTRDLVDAIQSRFSVKVSKVVITHWHQDNLGGLAFLNSRGLASYGLAQTVAECRKRGLPEPQIPFDKGVVIPYGTATLEAWWPGGGHTTDSIVVWFPVPRVLFGGCSVKSASSVTLGNTSDADIASWPSSLSAVRSRYPAALFVIPGHGNPGDLSLIDHTLSLFE